MVTEESTKDTVKTIVQGMPAVAVYPWLLTRVLFYAHAASGATRIRHSLRPLLISRVVRLKNSDAFVPRERGVASSSTVMPRFMRGIQYAAASRFKHDRLWNTGSPGQAGRRHRSEQVDLKTPYSRRRSRSSRRCDRRRRCSSDTPRCRRNRRARRTAARESAASHWQRIFRSPSAQPLNASAWAMPSPMPPLPPVMTATRPERSKMFMRCFLREFLQTFPWGVSIFWLDAGALA